MKRVIDYDYYLSRKIYKLLNEISYRNSNIFKSIYIYRHRSNFIIVATNV